VVALYDGAGAVGLAALDDVGHLGVDLQDPLLTVLVLHTPHTHILQRYDALHTERHSSVIASGVDNGTTVIRLSFLYSFFSSRAILLLHTDKKEKRIFLFIRKFRWDRLQSHI
jgi:hypothetical protein